jgi:hypothetical protein
MFYIVDQSFPTAAFPGVPSAPSPSVNETRSRINFLYMGLFLGFGKLGHER